MTPLPRAGASEVDVIVGPGEVRRLSIEEIQAQPERYVRDTSGRQWFLRQYYEDLMGLTENAQEAAR